MTRTVLQPHCFRNISCHSALVPHGILKLSAPKDSSSHLGYFFLPRIYNIISNISRLAKEMGMFISIALFDV